MQKGAKMPIEHGKLIQKVANNSFSAKAEWEAGCRDAGETVTGQEWRKKQAWFIFSDVLYHVQNLTVLTMILECAKIKA